MNLLTFINVLKMSASDKDQGNYYNNGGPIGVDHLHPNESPDVALQRIRTAGSVSIPPELFEKLYLSPENKVKGDLRKTFGNPTPMYAATGRQIIT